MVLSKLKFSVYIAIGGGFLLLIFHEFSPPAIASAVSIFIWIISSFTIKKRLQLESGFLFSFLMGWRPHISHNFMLKGTSFFCPALYSRKYFEELWSLQKGTKMFAQHSNRESKNHQHAIALIAIASHRNHKINNDIKLFTEHTVRNDRITFTMLWQPGNVIYYFLFSANWKIKLLLIYFHFSTLFPRLQIECYSVSIAIVLQNKSFININVCLAACIARLFFGVLCVPNVWLGFGMLCSKVCWI